MKLTPTFIALIAALIVAGILLIMGKEALAITSTAVIWGVYQQYRVYVKDSKIEKLEVENKILKQK